MQSEDSAEGLGPENEGKEWEENQWTRIPPTKREGGEKGSWSEILMNKDKDKAKASRQNHKESHLERANEMEGHEMA